MVYRRNGYKEKQLTLKRLGWKRVARNTERFGWVLGDATEYTETTITVDWEARIDGDKIYVNPRTHKNSKTRVWLTFYRSINVGAGVGFLEFLYNVTYYTRKISLFCMPFLWAATFLTIIFAVPEIGMKIIGWAIGSVIGWIGGIIWETIWARIAASVLKKRLNPYNDPYRLVLDSKSGSNNGVLTLCDILGKKTKYKFIESASYRGNNYVHLKALGKDQEVLCKVTQDASGKVIYDMQVDDDIVNAVVAEFERKSQSVRAAAPKPIPAPTSYTPPANDCPEPYGDDDGFITLKSKNGEEIKFLEVAGILYRGNHYAILQPVKLLDGMEDNEALVFRVARNAAGEDNFEVELNDEIIDAVFAEYNRLLDEAEGKRTA